MLFDLIRDAASFNRILTERLNEGAGGPNH